MAHDAGTTPPQPRHIQLLSLADVENTVYDCIETLSLDYQDYDYQPINAAMSRLRQLASDRSQSFSVAIQIGNSDDKLTQKQWSCFVLLLRDHIEQHGCQIHFWGASVNYEPWQNLCCVCEVPGDQLEKFQQGLADIRQQYFQDSVAVLIGKTELV